MRAGLGRFGPAIMGAALGAMSATLGLVWVLRAVDGTGGPAPTARRERRWILASTRRMSAASRPSGSTREAARC